MIQLNYDNTRANARRLCTVSDQCAQSRNRVHSAVNAVQGHWTGGASEAFLAAVRDWERENGKIESSIDTLSRQIIRIANEFEEAERALAAAAAAAAAQAQSGSAGGGGGTGGGGGRAF